MTRIYMDYAATAPLRPCAREAWIETSSALNPGGQYRSGREANALVSEARETIAECLDCEPIEVVFTSSGTEADNLAVAGFAAAKPDLPVASSPIEHPAVREVVSRLGCDYFRVGADGAVDPDSIREVLGSAHSVATMMLANNETGVVQPVDALVEAAAATNTPVHIDAVQAVGHIPVSFRELGAHTVAASAHKFGGPRGVGLLLARRSPVPSPILHGGGQQRGIRPGTVDVAGAVATAVALREACAEMSVEKQRLEALSEQLRSSLAQQIDTVIVHGRGQRVLPGHVHLSVPGAEGDSLIMLADSAGIECATGSACAAGVNRASEVLLAMGVSEADARSAVRFSLGRDTTQEDVERVVQEFPRIVEMARLAGMC
ncbi:Cysteine desulfurase [Corynebacterium ciconiae DSM 44920]|uniref:cysteine desulfurase family protein n=1 Tax=Corynebacterium ciconiae TaxID=227319 RepID=UPI00036EB8A1|nr:cysteine desulfurase family protein [Corynebacterium ciconiae]WKD61009.1 Cysteine desulfurase [Corynebacterium ciconiae DSM 44920]